MKKAKSQEESMRAEYKRGDFPKGLVRGKYAERLREARHMGVLKPKVAAAFNNEESVKALAVLSINIHSSVSVYLQIENQIKSALASGRLKSGDQLPSVRQLSEHLEVNPNTVSKAYRDLEVMGLLYTRRGMGFFVNQGVEDKCREECQRRVIGQLHEGVAEAKASGIPPKKIIDVVKASLAVDSSPYGPIPASVLTQSQAPGK